jgi:putative sterol carrier protein
VHRVENREEALAGDREDAVASLSCEIVDEDLATGALLGHPAATNVLGAEIQFVRIDTTVSHLTLHSGRGHWERQDWETEMQKSEMTEKLNAANAYVNGKRVKLDFGSEGIVMLDGVDQKVTEEDGPSDTTIKVAWADWQDMAAGKLDGMTAFMQGKLAVEGDMSNAMQLQGVLAKMAS